ncbi:MAG: hypothetical protein N2316_13900, partial [Spirochaetes bacterium]|nr:hypothetical protein [Spirochaetota bacterium]
MVQQSSVPIFELEKGELLDLDSLFRKENDLEKIANAILEGTFRAYDLQKKDSLDRFLDFIDFKVKTGNYYIIHLAYPAMRMADRELERKVIKVLNYHLYPDIILRILKFFTRNVHNSDSNLNLAFLIEADEIIKAIYETFVLFRNDIFISDPNKRTLNVKRIQQYPPTKENTHSSPLDAACRLKYILEFIALKQRTDHIYTKEDLILCTVKS